MTYQVMMVCTGNICRSAMAEIVLNEHLKKAGIDAVVVSSGVSNEEQGNPIDYRAKHTLEHAGYTVPAHSARQIKVSDLKESDLILAMTYRHYQALAQLAKNQGTSLYNDVPQSSGTPELEKLHMFREFDPKGEKNPAPSGKKESETAGISLPRTAENTKDVPDPWYGTQADFEETLATIERTIPALLAEIKRRIVSRKQTKL